MTPPAASRLSLDGAVMLPARTLRKFDALLRRERTEVLARLVGWPIGGFEPGRAQPTHPADVAGDLYDHEEALTVRGWLLQRLAEVDAALQRIRDGTYGRCEMCGTAIEPARLDAVPTARTRVHCQRQLEHAAAPRPPARER